VLDDIGRHGVDEIWCLGDLVGGGPEPVGVVDLVRLWPLVLVGNHDVWLADGAMWPDERAALDDARLTWLSGLPLSGRRHGIDCWHGSPDRPLDGFLTPQTAAVTLGQRPRGSWGLVGHTHDPALFLFDGVRVQGSIPRPESPVALAEGITMIANPGAVVGGRADPASWWLEIDTDARLLTWHRVRARNRRPPVTGLQLAH
jgi:hypothetical protein